MKIYAPEYYLDFKCIADKCRHSCCVGWEIDIDDDTLEKYESINEGYGKEISESIDLGDTPHFKLSADERCPHLDGRGLCRIITHLGEEYLCDICREHPRFYNDTAIGKMAGLGLSCEEAARIILSSDKYAKMIVIGETDEREQAFDFDVLPFIEGIYSVLSDTELSYCEKLVRVRNIGGYSDKIIDQERARELFLSLEYLNDYDRKLFADYRTPEHIPAIFEKMLERALAYFIYRHLPKARDEQELFAYLGFSLLCERLLGFLTLATHADCRERFVDLARIVSEEIEYSEDNTYAICSEFFC